MLALVGAVNLVGRVLAKRAAASSKPMPEPEASSRGPASVVRGSAGSAARQSVVRSQPMTRTRPSPSDRAPAAVVPAARASAELASPRKAPAAAAKPKAAPATNKSRNRWDARTLRRAFVVSEILGAPVGFRR